MPPQTWAGAPIHDLAPFTPPIRVHCISCGETDYKLPGDARCATCGNGTRPL